MREIPYETVLTRKDGSDPRTFVIRACTPDDLAEVTALQDAVFDAVPDKSTYFMTREWELEESLRLDKCFCAVMDGAIVGLTMMVVGRPGSRNAGNYLEYDEERLLTCVTMEVSFIGPAARGYGLQQIFFALREETARALGAKEALTTISPDNEFSLNNALRSGYTIITEMELYGGLRRYILRKEFK